jgi:hypothetical protein
MTSFIIGYILGGVINVGVVVLLIYRKGRNDLR